jgi:hypothetical protein
MDDFNLNEKSLRLWVLIQLVCQPGLSTWAPHQPTTELNGYTISAPMQSHNHYSSFIDSLTCRLLTRHVNSYRLDSCGPTTTGFGRTNPYTRYLLDA